MRYTEALKAVKELKELLNGNTTRLAYLDDEEYKDMREFVEYMDDLDFPLLLECVEENIIPKRD